MTNFSIGLLSILLTLFAQSAAGEIACSKIFEIVEFPDAGYSENLEVILSAAKLPPKESWEYIGDTNDQVYKLKLSEDLSVVWRGIDDSTAYEVAAYHVDKLFGFSVVPVTVKRRYMRQWGSIQYFANNLSWAPVQPPPKIMIFDYLIANDDRGVGHNFHLTRSNKPVAFDHENGFKTDLEDFPITMRDLRVSTEQLNDNALLDRIRSIPAKEIRLKLAAHLPANLIDGIIKRRNTYVRSILNKMSTSDERNVLPFNGDATISKKYAKGLDRIKRNNFNTERTMQDYREDFGGKLLAILKRLDRRSQSWTDMGAGSANAQISFLRARLRTSQLENIPELRPISYSIPKESTARIRRLEDQFPENFRYSEGLQTPASIRKMKPTDLITDNTGIVQYAKSVGLNTIEFVKAYIDILKPGGSLLISPFTKESLSLLPNHYLRDLEIVEVIEKEEISPFLIIKKRGDTL